MSRINNLANTLSTLLIFSEDISHLNVSSVLEQFSTSIDIEGGYAGFISIIMRMVDSAVDDVLQAPNLPQERRHLHVARVTRTRDLVAAFVRHIKWAEIVPQHLNEELIETLQIVDDAVVSGGVYNPFSKEDAEKYADTLTEILKDVLSCDLDVTLKRGITSHLEVLINIFRKFEFFGAQDAELRMKAILGGFVIFSDEFESQSDEAKETLRPLLQFVKSLYPTFKFSADLGLTVANGAMLAIQVSG